MNRPAKGFAPPMTFFTIRVREGRKPPLVRVLQGAAGGDFIGGGRTAPVDTGAGLPHFRDVAFRGEFPFAFVELKDSTMPVVVTLESFSPFIPLNDRDSSIPVAVLLYRIRNCCGRKLEVALFGSLTNVVGHPDAEGRVNRVRRESSLSGVYMTTTAHPPNSHRFGSMALTTRPGAKVWRNWRDSRRNKFWEVVAQARVFPPASGAELTATIATTIALEPDAEAVVPFFIAWHFPVFRHWHPGACEQAGWPSTWRNYYATQ